MRIVIDAMGGDYAPDVNIKGAFLALEQSPSLHLTLVGDEAILNARLRKRRFKGLRKRYASRMNVVHAPEVIGMEEHASSALRKKTHSSLHVGLALVKEGKGKGEAFLSAGNSGAVMAASMVVLKRLPSIERPAIIVKVPTTTGSVSLLDAGANVDCKPEQLVQFAQMGRLYAMVIDGIASPRIGLLSNGSESHKGTEPIRETHEKLTASKFPGYVGYVEGHDVFRGACDVVVCDGFIGNVVLKTAEGLADMVTQWFKQALKKNVTGLLGLVLLRKLLVKFKAKFHYQAYGAAPLLGVDGVVMIAHGKSSEIAILNGILTAFKAVEQDFIRKIRDQIGTP